MDEKQTRSVWEVVRGRFRPAPTVQALGQFPGYVDASDFMLSERALHPGWNLWVEERPHALVLVGDVWVFQRDKNEVLP